MDPNMMNQGMMDPNMMNYNNQGMMQNDMNYNQFPNNGMMQNDYNQNMMNQGMQTGFNPNMAPNGFGVGMDASSFNQPMVSNDMMNAGYNNNPSGPDMNYNQVNLNNYNQGDMNYNQTPMNMDYNQTPITIQPSNSTFSPTIDMPNLANEVNNEMGMPSQVNSNMIQENNDSSINLVSEGELSKYQEVEEKKEEPMEENPPEVPDKEDHKDIETLDEPQLPREIEKEMQLAGANVPKEEEKEEKKEETVPVDANPLDNGSNPVPVNPILTEIEKHQNVEEIGEQKDVKANVFAALGIIFGMVVKPGTTMINNSKKFKEMNKAFSIMLWLSLLFLIICIAMRVVVGSFDRTYVSLTDSYKLIFNPGKIFELSNYLEFIIISVSLSIGGVLLVAIMYYASSFINSKGVHFATYLIVSNLGMIPLIVGTIVVYPVAMIFSGYLALGVLIFSFLATLITILIGMNNVLKFKNVNVQIFYHVINLSVITLVAIVVFVFMVHNAWVILPQMNI
jgi:hypothetical protein